jgi:LuxR family transcriptional regulator, maltose regulon positive regulatory protein
MASPTAMITDFSPRARANGKQPARTDRPASATLMPVPDVLRSDRVWVMAAFLLGAIARDALGELADAKPTLTSAGRHREALTHGETRVLHYLPTNLSAREIADELYLSVNTVKTHQRHLYAKLGARSRTQAVEQARALGLLAPSSHRR